MRWAEKIAHALVMVSVVGYSLYTLVILGNPDRIPDWATLCPLPLALVFCTSAGRMFWHLSQDSCPDYEP